MVKSLIQLLSARQTSILSGATVLMVMVFASRFLGLIRDRLLVHQYDSAQAAVFFAAFRLPDLMFQLLIFGALSVAFIPVFTEVLHRDGEKAAFEFANNILNIALLLFGGLAVVAFIFVSPLNALLVPGFSGEQKQMTDHLTQIMLLGQILLVIGSFFVGISQSFQRFIIPALAPLAYNIGVLIGIIFLAPWFGILGVAYGVVIGAALHVLVQLPMVNGLGFRYRFSLDFLNHGVKDVVKMMSVRNIGLAVEQINDSVSLALASLISYSSVTLITFAQHLQFVPIGLFGATIAQAALPVLSGARSRGEMESFKMTLLTTIHQILFLTLPSAAILIVLRIPVVRLVFGASQFSWIDTVLTGRTVALLALSIAAQSLIFLLVRAFFALKDTKTPVAVSFVNVTINISLCWIFVQILHWDVWALGLAFTISANTSLILLMFLLDRRLGGLGRRQLLMPAAKMLLAAVVAAVALYIPIKALDQLVFDTTKTINLMILTGIASVFGLGVYLLLVWLFKIRELETFLTLIKKLRRMNAKPNSGEMANEVAGEQ